MHSPDRLTSRWTIADQQAFLDLPEEVRRVAEFALVIVQQIESLRPEI